MQKVLRQWTADGQLHGEWCYTAEDVDAYRQAVKELVEAAKNIDQWDWFEVMRDSDCSDKDEIIQNAQELGREIAAVERLEVE